MYLMLQNKEVLYFDFDDFIVEEINSNLLPYSLREQIRKSSNMRDILHNVQIVKEWLAQRVLSLSRSNAKQLYAMFQIPQRQDLETRLQVCLNCKGVSIIDSYWVKENETDRFSDVNIRVNSFKEILDVALYGYNPTITMNMICPDLTTQGLFRKAWIRDENELYLLKSDNTTNNISTKMEVLASKILDCFNNKISCVSYSGRIRNTASGKIYVDKCKNFVDERYSFVEAWELLEYARNNGISYIDYFNQFEHSPDIAVLDYILVNTDRHLQNYGYLMNNKNGNIIGLAPLFDFNCALIADYFNRNAEDTISQMFNSKDTLYDLALRYKNYSRISLNLKKFKDLKTKYKKYDYIFDKVLERCYKIGIDISQ